MTGQVDLARVPEAMGQAHLAERAHRFTADEWNLRADLAGADGAFVAVESSLASAPAGPNAPRIAKSG